MLLRRSVYVLKTASAVVLLTICWTIVSQEMPSLKIVINILLNALPMKLLWFIWCHKDDSELGASALTCTCTGALSIWFIIEKEKYEFIVGNWWKK